jgi:hypothetical protein
MKILLHLEQAEQISKLYQENTADLKELFQRQVKLGRMLSSIQQEMGSKDFKNWLRKFCRPVPWKDAQMLMGLADSPLATEG